MQRAPGALLLIFTEKQAQFTRLALRGAIELAGCSTDATNCAHNTVDHIHNLYLGANVAIAVGLASLAGAYWAYAHHSAKESASSEAYRFDVQPTKSGAVASIGGSF